MKVAVLASGSGTNLQAIVDAAAADPDFGAEIALVLTDRPGAGALARAETAGIPTAVVEWGGDRTDFTRRICDVVAGRGCEAMVLAGFMRVLGPEAVRRFPDRILNIHPALLPSFPGAHGVADALAYGVKVAGVTVHLVDEEVDHGPIVSQAAVPVLPGDDEAALHARIQVEEHRLFPEAVKALAAGRLEIEGRTVRWRET